MSNLDWEDVVVSATDNSDSEWADTDNLSTPSREYSIFNADDRAKAVEGAKIAFMGDELGELDISNIPGNVMEGVGNGIVGTGAGVSEFVGDVGNFFIPDSLGGNEFEARWDNQANYMRGLQSDNSAIGAIGEELGYGAGIGGAVGKAVDVGVGVGKAVGRIANSKVLGRGKAYLDDVNKEIAKADRRVKSRVKKTDKALEIAAFDDALATTKTPSGLPYVTAKEQKAAKGILSRAEKKAEFARSNAKRVEIEAAKRHRKLREDKLPTFVGATLVNDLIGKVSPKARDVLNNSWDNVAAYGLGSKPAAARKYLNLKDDLTDVQGYAESTAKRKINNTINRVGPDKQAAAAIIDSIFKTPNNATSLGATAATIATPDIDTTTVIRKDGINWRRLPNGSYQEVE